MTLCKLAHVEELGTASTTVCDNEPKSESLMLLCYTSGTTGDAKGVRLTHRNLIHDVESFREMITTDPSSVIISYLPYPHVFEQALMGSIMAGGGKIGYFSGNPANLLADMAVL